nr:hypothetical protein GTC16762_08980 [Pigmentibacter ruber]
MLKIAIIMISFNFVNLAFSSSEKNFNFDSKLIVNDSSFEELSTSYRSGGCFGNDRFRDRGSSKDRGSSNNSGGGVSRGR